MKLILKWIIFLFIEIKGSLFFKKICSCCKQPYECGTVEWSFLRIFLITKIAFNSVKTTGNNRSAFSRQVERNFAPRDLTFWTVKPLGTRSCYIKHNACMSAGNCGGFSYPFYWGLPFIYSVRTSFVSFWSIIANEIFFQLGWNGEVYRNLDQKDLFTSNLVRHALYFVTKCSSTGILQLNNLPLNSQGSFAFTNAQKVWYYFYMNELRKWYQLQTHR